MSSFNTDLPPLKTSTTQPITTRPRSIRPILVVFNEDIQKGVGGIPSVISRAYCFAMAVCDLQQQCKMRKRRHGNAKRN